MNDALLTGPPEKDEAATRSANRASGDVFGHNDSLDITTPTVADAPPIDTEWLLRLARSIMPGGAMRKYLRHESPWCRRAGDDAFVSLMIGRPDPIEIDLLLKAHDRAIARRNRERRSAEQEKQLRALARRLKRGEHVPGGLTAILGPAGVK